MSSMKYLRYIRYYWISMNRGSFHKAYQTIILTLVNKDAMQENLLDYEDTDTAQDITYDSSNERNIGSICTFLVLVIISSLL